MFWEKSRTLEKIGIGRSPFPFFEKFRDFSRNPILNTGLYFFCDVSTGFWTFSYQWNLFTAVATDNGILNLPTAVAANIGDDGDGDVLYVDLFVDV